MDASDYFGLKGKVCVITGGAGGIGRASAQRLADIGARIAVLDLALPGAQETARLVGGGAIALACDTTDPAAVEAAAARVARELGPCHALVNNAGIVRSAATESMSLAEWNATLSVNLTGYFLCAQAFGRQMLENGGGAVVHIASIAATHPTPMSSIYSASKGGVVMLSRALAVEWAGRGVRSNTISPGFIRTPMTERAYALPEVFAARAAATPAGRIGAPEDIADAVVFLASERARFITGVELGVDGGLARNLIPLASEVRN